MKVPPQQQVATRGQRLDDLRNLPRSYVWPGKPTVWTYTIGTWAAGTFTLDIQGIEFTSTTSTDAPTAILELLNDFNSKTSAKELAFVTANNNVLTIQAYSAGVSFTVTEVAAAGGSVTTLADATVVNGRLALGIAVALDETNTGAVRELRAGDTQASIIGFTTENTELELSDGTENSIDGWEPGATVSITDEGLIPVAVEGDSSLLLATDPVWVQIQSPGGEEIGAVRRDADGANTIPAALTNARYNDNGYDDEQGRATVELMVRMP